MTYYQIQTENIKINQLQATINNPISEIVLITYVNRLEMAFWHYLFLIML